MKPITCTIEPEIAAPGVEGTGGNAKDTDLPFIKKGKRGAPINYWHVEPTGRGTEDWIIGRYYGVEVVNFILRVRMDITLLGRVLAALPKEKEWTMVEVGFVAFIQEQFIIDRVIQDR